MAGDASALGIAGFGALFRGAVHTAMRMGSPNATIDKATFRWDRARTYNPQDPAGEPYHWDQVPATNLDRPDVVVDEVAVDYLSARAIAGTAVGDFLPLKAELTMLDVDRQRVVGANWVLLHEVPFAVIAETMVALFDVDVYTLYLERQ